MTPFQLIDGRLHCEQVALDRIAEEFGTPCYVYSATYLDDAFRRYDQAFAAHPHLVCYAVKANSSLAILNRFARMGAGFDIVSGGELARVLAAGGDPSKVLFSGVGKTEAEMRAALEAGILCFNVESESELQRLNRMAGSLGKIAPISLRVNPNVDAKTHPYISTGLKDNKFGIAHDQALRVYRKAAELPHLNIVGIDCHIGSQLTDISPYAEALEKVLQLVTDLEREGITLHHIDMGGGIGIRYKDEIAPDLNIYAATLLDELKGRGQTLILEPGRSLVGNSGALLTRVEYLKHGEHKDFCIVDAAMNDLMRPALYDAWHDIQPVVPRQGETHRYEIVGPVCESGDFLGHDRNLALQENDLLAILSAGAYGMSMSSNYNTRPRASEVLVDKDQCHLIRKREQYSDLLGLEHVPE